MCQAVRVSRKKRESSSGLGVIKSSQYLGIGKFLANSGETDCIARCSFVLATSLGISYPPFALTQSVVFQENLTATASVII
jgi:hypothetical protein